jgi:Cellulase (glycosyl hydrolase family 5)/Calx-beta domain
MLLHRAVVSLVAVFFIYGSASMPTHAAATDTLYLAHATSVLVQNSGVENVIVYRSGSSSGAARVLCHTVNDTAIAGRDFTAVSTTLQWASGDSTPKQCSVPISDATPYSGPRIFFVELADPTGAALTTADKVTVTIWGNKGGGTASVAAPTYTVAQGAGNMTISVNRAGGSVGTATVYYATANKTAIAGTDYTAEQGTLNWANGDAAPKSFSIPISNAKPFTGTKTLAVAIAHAINVDLGAQTSAIVTIDGDASSAPAVTKTTESGFFIANGKLYDMNSNEFRIRGVDRLHYDSDSAAGIAKSGANAVRFALYLTSVGAAKYVSVLQTQHIANHEAVIPSMFYFPDNTVASGNQSTTELADGVAWWVSNASAFTALNRYMILNIANEWGPANSTVWRDSYISAIAKLRAAGYVGPLMIDSGGYGQDADDLLNYSSAVFNSDPQRNIIFSYHVYGGYTTLTTLAGLNTLAAQLAKLSASDGMVFVFGEFGPGRDIGPSPTLITPGQVITAAETNGIGWLGWAWDDNDLAGAKSDNNWFSMTYAGPGIYTQTSDLTTFGQDVVLNPTYGLQVLAKPASIF